MKSKFTWVGIIAIVVLGISTFFVGCKEEGLNDVVKYHGQVVYINTTTPFPDLTVKVTDGHNTHCQTQTDAGGLFSLKVRISEINNDYYLLAGDSTCVPKKVNLSGFGQFEVDLGVIEVEGPTLPVVTTAAISNITAESATCGGNVTSDGRSSVTARGICWAKTEYPTVNDPHTTNGTGKGEFQSQLIGLEHGTTYYARAYATNSIGTSYGEQVKFSTTTGLPAITTDNVSNVLATSATCGGTVGDNSGYAITACGLCWSDKTATPTTGNEHTTEVATTGHFTSLMIGLNPNSTYYVRAYATNTMGTNYGNTVTFTTLSGLPEVSTNPVTEIKASTALCGGDVKNNGGYTITARGVCWSKTSSTPTTADSHTNEVTGNGIFTSLITGLEANTTYYVRAYATNEIGTSYGASVSFTSGNGLPVVETLDPGENITGTSIIAVGNVIDDGSSFIIERGVVYSTLPNPTLQNATKVIGGSGSGYFTVSITGINTANNTYYIRAYASNANGTSYGEQITITPEHYEYYSLKTMIYGGYTYRIKFLGEMSWQGGTGTCTNMVYGGYDDWFIPNREEVQQILTIYGVWNKTITSKSNSILLIQGCSDLWTSEESGSSTAYCYSLIDDGTYVYNPSTGKTTEEFLWSWQSDSSSKSEIKGVFALRKYRKDN